MERKLTLNQLLTSDEAGFTDFLGGIYEKSPWVAEKFYAAKPADGLDTVTAVAEAMKAIVDAESDEVKLKLICDHPDLAGKAALAGEVTEESKTEQVLHYFQPMHRLLFPKALLTSTKYTPNIFYPLIYPSFYPKKKRNVRV
jgi:2-oxo-4-hydroxy-4-carboxy--5-ureidoimidazoline (OHCU) decarboxylase